MSEEFTMNVKGLDQLLKALKQKPPVGRVGILGKSNGPHHPEGNKTSNHVPTNAEVGATHEFGTSYLPQRSFLRIPISEHLEKQMEKSGAFDKSAMNSVIQQGSVVPWLKKIAILANSIVLEAFNTGGYGKWKPSNMEYKKTKQTLVETQQLRNSITWEVNESG